MSEKKSRWLSFNHGFVFGFGTLGVISGMHLSVWLLLAWFCITISMYLFGLLVIEGTDE